MSLFMSAVARGELGDHRDAEKNRLVLTNFFYLSNIRPVSWGGQRNVWVLTMYRRKENQIRRANDASTGHAFVVCPAANETSVSAASTEK